MRKIVLAILILLYPTLANATTYYIRSDGGTATQCTGTTDAAYPGTGTAQPCALNHPNWTFPPGASDSTSKKAVSGDIVVIEGSDQGGTGQYRIGCQNSTSCRDSSVNQTTSATCDTAWPKTCTMGRIPSDVTFIGCTTSGCGCSPVYNSTKHNWEMSCTHPVPELWGAGSVYHIIYMGASGDLISDMEITDHSGCGYRVGSPLCNETATSVSARNGIQISGTSDGTLKNLWIHGVGYSGIYGHVTGNVTFDDVNIDKTPFAGWDNDDGSATTGNPTFQNYSHITYPGCIEAYPLTGNTKNTRDDIVQCIDQNSSGYGDGIGTHDGTSGHWTFKNFEGSHAVQDMIDLLHALNNGQIDILDSRFEGNTGQAVKTSMVNTNIENSILVGSCDYFNIAGITLATGFTVCRANGAVVVASPNQANATLNIKNSSFWGGNVSIESSTSSTCNGTQSVNIYNSIFYGSASQTGSGQQTNFYYCDGSDGNGTGACCNGSTKVAVNWYNSVAYHGKYSISGTNIISTDPHIGQGDIVNTTPDTDRFDFSLTANSSALFGAADNTVTGVSDLSVDFNNFDRGADWDIGALEYGSIPTAGGGSSPSTGPGFSITGSISGIWK